jgi:hypothetical protein
MDGGGDGGWLAVERMESMVGIGGVDCGIVAWNSLGHLTSNAMEME